MKSDNYIEEVHPSILWLLIELLCATILCSIPVMWAQNLNNQTLLQGLIIASILLVPSEFLRQFVGYARLRGFLTRIYALSTSTDDLSSLHKRLSRLEVSAKLLDIRFEESLAEAFTPLQEKLIRVESLYERLERVEREMTLIAQSIELKRTIGSKDKEFLRHLTIQYIHLALEYLRKGNSRTALMCLRESIDMYERYGERQDEAYMLYRYAMLQDLDDKQSINFLEQALRIILRNAEKN